MNSGDWLQRSKLCNQIRSHGVWFGKRAVVGAVRVFESYLGATFFFWATDLHGRTRTNPSVEVQSVLSVKVGGLKQKT